MATVAGRISWAIVRPETRRAIVTIAERLNRSGIAYQIGGDVLLHALDLNGDVDAIELVFPAAARNELAKLLHEATGVAAEFGVDEEPFAPAWRCVHHWGTETLDCIGGMAVDMGGSVIRLPYRPGRTWHLDGVEIPLAPAGQLADPTGCGDAYRAGLLYGLQNELDWELPGRIASLLGAIKIEHAGTQNHAFARSDFDARFRDTFGFSL